MSGERERRWKHKVANSTQDQRDILLFRTLALIHRTERSINLLQREIYGDEERSQLCCKIAAVMRKKMRTIWKTDAVWTPFLMESPGELMFQRDKRATP